MPVLIVKTYVLTFWRASLAFFDYVHCSRQQLMAVLLAGMGWRIVPLRPNAFCLIFPVV